MTLTESLIQKAQHVGLNTYYMPISYDDFIQLGMITIRTEE